MMFAKPSCLLLISVAALTYFSQVSAHPTEQQADDQKLYEKADKYFKAVDKTLDTTHLLPSEADKNKVVENAQIIAQKVGSDVYDKVKSVIDELYGSKDEDSSPYQFFKQTRELIKEKLAPLEAQLSDPRNKKQLLNGLQDEIKRSADSLYNTIKQAEEESNQEQKKELHVYREILEEMKSKNVHLQDKLDKLDNLYVTMLRGFTDDLENTVKENKNRLAI